MQFTSSLLFLAIVGQVLIQYGNSCPIGQTIADTTAEQARLDAVATQARAFEADLTIKATTADSLAKSTADIANGDPSNVPAAIEAKDAAAASVIATQKAQDADKAAVIAEKAATDYKASVANC
uniref:Secreted protein n=1 Tax=Rhabditophanes sp. KR3021 TaxID=114890 RepID=A0AC35U3G8_9BILA